MSSSAGAGRDDEPPATQGNVDVPGGPAPSARGGEPVPGAQARPERVVKRTRISAAWAAAIVGVLVLILLLIFILQNQDSATVNFLWMSGSLPVGVGVLLAAVGGALLVALLGAARILQLRHRFRKANGGRHQA